MTPSRPAPSKRWNQSCGDRPVSGRRRHVERRRGVGEDALELGAPLCEGRVAEVAVAEGEEVEEDDRRGHLAGEQLHARFGRVEAELQRLEVEPARPGR